MQSATNPEDLATSLHSPVAAQIGAHLIARGERLAVCETTAGGLISAQLLAVPGASAWFDRGVVAYGGTSKQDTTGVSASDLRERGAVSVGAVELMASSLRTLAAVTWAVAESGIAGPQTSRRSVKPAGTVCIAVAGPSGVVSGEYFVAGDRAEVMVGIAAKCLELVLAALEG